MTTIVNYGDRVEFNGKEMICPKCKSKKIRYVNKGWIRDNFHHVCNECRFESKNGYVFTSYRLKKAGKAVLDELGLSFNPSKRDSR